jgi:hypothetical protein
LDFGAGIADAVGITAADAVDAAEAADAVTVENLCLKQ